MPIRDTVAGEACSRLLVSNIKLTFCPNWMRHPEGRVRRRLSSSTEFRASIHSGSISPSQTTHDHTSVMVKTIELTNTSTGWILPKSLFWLIRTQFTRSWLYNVKGRSKSLEKSYPESGWRSPKRLPIWHRQSTGGCRDRCDLAGSCDSSLLGISRIPRSTCLGWSVPEWEDITSNGSRIKDLRFYSK